MAEQFKLGDVVVLKSGGPKMTITSREGGRVWCEWFANGKENGRYFEEIALRPATATD